MINPTWSLCILLVIPLSIVSLFVAIYNVCNVDHCKSFILLLHLGICSAGFLFLLFAIVSPVLAGKSFCGRKTAILSVNYYNYTYIAPISILLFSCHGCTLNPANLPLIVHSEERL